MKDQVNGVGLDTHCHFWDLDKFAYPWPTEDLKIYKNHLPDDLWRDMADVDVSDVIFVQCLNDSIEEAEWISALAKSHPRIKGIVAGLDPAGEMFEEKLVKLRSSVPELVGLRHILDFEPIDYLKKNIDRIAINLNKLHGYGLTFDLLLRPHLLDDAIELVSKVPETSLVIDHIAKPYIKDGLTQPWKQNMQLLSSQKNVYCKLSGLVTEADLTSWKIDDFRPYAQHVLSCFGKERLMFGSDWPVCTLAGADYRSVHSLLKELLDGDQNAYQNIMTTTPRSFYNIKN